MPAFPDLHEPLSDGTVTLRLPAEWDIPDILIAHQDDPRLHAALGLERPPSGAELGRQIEWAPEERASGTALQLTITAAGSDDCAGRLSVHEVIWRHRRAEIGMWIAPGLRGQGYATRALTLFTPWLFLHAALDRLAILTETGNAAMRGAAARAGFVEEGVLRDFARDGSRAVDFVCLSRLRRDAPPSAG